MIELFFFWAVMILIDNRYHRIFDNIDLGIYIFFVQKGGIYYGKD